MAGNDTIMRYLIDKIKEKKELSSVADKIVDESLYNYMRKNKIPASSLASFNEQDFKVLIKGVRRELRNIAGSFQKDISQRYELLEKGDLIELLGTHKSTRERLPYYPQIKKFISEIGVKTVLDLGAGLNPIAMASKEIAYYAYDIHQSEVDLLNRFFEKYELAGQAYIYDVRKVTAKSLPMCDMCFLFKVLDVLEKRGHKLAEKIISQLRCRYLLISFSTKTLSGKSMNHPQRGWIEQLLMRLGYVYTVLNLPNEVFYLVDKKNLV